MKLYNKIGLFAAGALMMTSCAVNDPFAEKMQIGEVVPTVSWELSSSVCKAGNEAGFLAKYYTTAEGVSIDHSEVWAMVTRTESAAATQKLISSPAYTKTVNFIDTVRGFHLLAEFPHAMAELNGNEYHLNAAFPTSRTLGPVAWQTPGTWAEDMFTAYYPATFKEEFCAQMLKYLTDGDTYLSGLRQAYLNYDFTAEQVAAVNANHADLKPLPFPAEGEVKDDLWFANDTEVVTGYYYFVVENGVSKEVEVATKEEAIQAGIKEELIYDVYKSPHWLYCRYSDNTGGAITSLREEYRPMWKELLQLIPFEAWIYNGPEKTYSVDFTRKYALEVQFKVIDTKGGIGRDTEVKTIDLN